MAVLFHSTLRMLKVENRKTETEINKTLTRVRLTEHRKEYNTEYNRD